LNHASESNVVAFLTSCVIAPTTGSNNKKPENHPNRTNLVVVSINKMKHQDLSRIRKKEFVIPKQNIIKSQ
jgi:hypothetical protein